MPFLKFAYKHQCGGGLWDRVRACEDANSKLVEVATVADDDAEKRIDDSLVQISKLGHKVKILFSLWARVLVKVNWMYFLFGN